MRNAKAVALSQLHALDVEIEQAVRLVRRLFRGWERFRAVRRLAAKLPCAEKERALTIMAGEIVRIDFQRFVGELFAFGLIAARQSALRGGDIRVHGFVGLAHA